MSVQQPMERIEQQRLLELLRAHRGSFVSGEQLSRILGVSRTAIWKQIQQLRRHGAEIVTVARKGYLLSYEHERWPQRTALQEQLVGTIGSDSPFTKNVECYETVSSTQTVAHQFAAEGAPHGTVILAEQQTAGRGRLQRQWESPYARGILLSIILRTELAVHLSSQLALLTAVALCQAIRNVSHLSVGIKWPNDVLWQGKKVSGLLLETVSEASRVRYAIVGVGINVNHQLADFSPALQSTVSSLRTALADQPLERMQLLAAFIKAMEYWLQQYESLGFDPIREQWCAWNVSLGERVRLTTNKGVVEGVAETIDDIGAIIIRTDDGQRLKNYSGDLELVPLP